MKIFLQRPKAKLCRLMWFECLLPHTRYENIEQKHCFQKLLCSLTCQYLFTKGINPSLCFVGKSALYHLKIGLKYSFPFFITTPPSRLMNRLVLSSNCVSKVSASNILWGNLGQLQLAQLIAKWIRGSLNFRMISFSN